LSLLIGFFQRQQIRTEKFQKTVIGCPNTSELFVSFSEKVITGEDSIGGRSERFLAGFREPDDSSQNHRSDA
jgi:hypothetical protein